MNMKLNKLVFSLRKIKVKLNCKSQRNLYEPTRMNFNKRLFLWLSLAFVFATVIGTLTHECGHYVVAKSFGYHARINYAFTLWYDPNNIEFTNSTYSKYQKEIETDRDFPEKEKYMKIIEMHNRNGFWIGLGGPLETMLTGTIGLIFLFLFRKSFENQTKLTLKQWLLIFISLFWLRQLANFVGWVGYYMVTGELRERMDEIHISTHFNLPQFTIPALTGLIGVIVLLTVIFKFVPTKQRLTFIASGLVGGIIGAILWLGLLGKVIMP